jgi:hypothetical protein
MLEASERIKGEAELKAFAAFPSIPGTSISPQQLYHTLTALRSTDGLFSVPLPSRSVHAPFSIFPSF